MLHAANSARIGVPNGIAACRRPTRAVAGRSVSRAPGANAAAAGRRGGRLCSAQQMIVRDADPQRDAAACAAIYAPYVSDSVASFEAQPPTAGEMSDRIGAAHAWFVAEHDGVVGYSYGSPHRERAAYRWAADVAVYIDARHHRSGVGRALYDRLCERLHAIGLWTLCAGITQPNDASNGLHRTMGFVPVGTYRRIGWKAGAWRDVQWWQLDLRPGEPGPPGELELDAQRPTSDGDATSPGTVRLSDRGARRAPSRTGVVS
jgi:phosphinothricin acetyltransferase